MPANPSLYKSHPKTLPPEEISVRIERYRKALQHGIPAKHLIQSGRFKGIPHDLLIQVSSEERRNRAKRQAVQTGRGDVR